MRLGLLGAGMIATCDWGVLPGLKAISDRAHVVAIASPSLDKTRNVAQEFGIPHVFQDLEGMLRSVELDAVVNLTPIPLHASTSKTILSAGKHLVTEKPLASTMAEADELVDLADEKGVIIVCSPPRMLEPARIRAKKLIRDGAIGRVAFARVRSSHAGPAWRAWPANPAWFYQADSGPLLDMGVYGIQEITGILGPATAVTAVGGRTASQRRVAGGPYDGDVVPVEVNDNVIVILHFGEAMYAIVDCTFNVRAARSPDIEIFGHAGTLNVNDGAGRRHSVELYRVAEDGVGGAWENAEGDTFEDDNGRVRSLKRAILVEHLLDCIDSGTRSQLSGEHARHSLEIMLAARQSAETGRRVQLVTSF